MCSQTPFFISSQNFTKLFLTLFLNSWFRNDWKWMAQIRFQITRNFLPHAMRERSIIISRFLLCAPPHVENYNYPRVSACIRSGIVKRRAFASLRREYLWNVMSRWKARNVSSSRELLLENGSTFYVPAYGEM